MTTLSHHHHPGANHQIPLATLFGHIRATQREGAIMTVAAQNLPKVTVKSSKLSRQAGRMSPKNATPFEVHVSLMGLHQVPQKSCHFENKSSLTTPGGMSPRKSHRCTLLRGALTTVLSSKVRACTLSTATCSYLFVHVRARSSYYYSVIPFHSISFHSISRSIDSVCRS